MISDERIEELGQAAGLYTIYAQAQPVMEDGIIRWKQSGRKTWYGNSLISFVRLIEEELSK
jgi:hypothetical protein